MKIHLAHHYGLCFGVRDAITAAEEAAASGPLTVLGALVHNPVVTQRLADLGVQSANLSDTGSATTDRVLITAHGASQGDKARWRATVGEVIDTTCPLVTNAHEKLARLVREGCFPVVIGQPRHVEVRGLIGDYPEGVVVENEHDVHQIPKRCRYGVVAQTTQPIEKVQAIVEAIRTKFFAAEVRFIDTVCRPTRQRQVALEALCRQCDHVVVIGGRTSNNTGQLASKAHELGVRVTRIEHANELHEASFQNCRHVGVTAGTSTLEATVQEVVRRLREMANRLSEEGAQ